LRQCRPSGTQKGRWAFTLTSAYDFCARAEADPRRMPGLARTFVQRSQVTEPGKPAGVPLYRIDIDVGGTFTGLVIRPGDVLVLKWGGGG
jgi:hypothetical protein